MKKILALLYTISIFGLASCEEIPSFNLSVEFDNNHLAQSLISYPKSGNYKAGTILEVKSKIIYDAGLYVYLNNNSINQIDNNGEWTYSFEMPARDSKLYITMDQFYGKDEYTFEYLFSWSYQIEKDITKIKYETSDIGILPNKFTDVIYTEDKDDINLFYELLQEPLIRYKGQLKSEGKYEKITYYVNDCAHELLIHNNIIYWHDFSNSAYFSFKNNSYKVPKIKTPSLECFSFSNKIKYADVYYQSKENEWINQGTFTQLFSFEFVEYAGNLQNYYAYIDTRDYDKIYIYSDRLFEYQGQFYEIVGYYDFSLLPI